MFSKKSVLISLYIIYIRFLCIVVGIGFFYVSENQKWKSEIRKK
nr:MAG TPA: hypothetical protein [Caudoviricetes sp.]